MPGLFDGGGGGLFGGLFGRRPAAAPGTDPNAAYQMPQVPWGQKDAVTLAALGLISGPTLNQGIQNAAQMVPAGLAADTAKRRDMYSLQEKARTDAEAKAEKARQYAAMNVGLKLRSGVPLASLTPAEQAAWAAAPEIALKLSEPQVVGRDSTIWNPMEGPYQPGPTAPDAATNANIIQVRKELAGKEGMTRYNLTQPVLQSMAASVDSKSAMSDFDFVYGMAQIYDPTSVVRDKEQNFVLQGQSIPEQWKGLMQKVLNGQAELGPDARRRLVNATRTRVESYRRQAEREVKYYTETVAPGMEIRPEMIAPPLADLPAAFEVPDIPDINNLPSAG